MHPFLDGTGRLGRLLITFLLCEAGALKEPELYLSLYFKAHRKRYYELLQSVRETGDWHSWILFFLEGLVETATQATDTAGQLLDLFEKDRRATSALGRPAASSLREHELLKKRPLLSVPATTKDLSLSRPTVAKPIEHLANQASSEKSLRSSGAVSMLRLVLAKFTELLARVGSFFGCGRSTSKCPSSCAIAQY
ncbi:Fic family protein [Bradyrhizobium sp. 193]|nr:Fic family protein [Bradyrhizobium sp. 193]MCK1500214.1 Fic family protein [Bradyrhizobium sp. 188]MCK1571665.1 Fic family protein [Bradyrhizobium sp. 174]MCK1584133.1 Fic family protein [Bradyrhizobium sp. 168]MCK1634807.1 Fic family protein [Bradyrhizobium sp. 162]MCK1697528.1 Fic family protein [Bradyrhizobium sp. 144]UPJ84908.1 Fic family protein [Bradyrhizobium sp. 184]UPJ92710.1 Fic family protein [Bradyrhizobium sp. 183]